MRLYLEALEVLDMTNTLLDNLDHADDELQVNEEQQEKKNDDVV